MTLVTPPLTVALLTYNRVHYLKESITAILEQSYQDFELLVLDNCSPDGTAQFVLGLQDPRIRYVRNSRHISTVQFNCCSAYHLAVAPRVIVTHDDDIMERDMLERQMRFMDDHPEVGLVWTRVSDIDQDGQAIAHHRVDSGLERVFAPGEYITSFLKERLWPMPSGVMLRRAVLPKSYAVRECFDNGRVRKSTLDTAGIEDVVMPASINRRHPVGYLDQPLLRRRVHTNQFSHAASLSLPGVHLYRKLKRIAKQVPGLEAHAVHFDVCVARFLIQEAITTQQSRSLPKGILKKIDDTATTLVNNKARAPEAFLAGLPMFLLAHLLAPGAHACDLADLRADEHERATHRLLAWAQQAVAHPETSILASLQGRRIVIFGSAFIAALLILEAEKNNDRVVACVDSNVNRQGRTLLGVPIQPLSWMAQNVEAGDVVIISSERDHDHYIEALIRQHVQTQARSLSWKTLPGSAQS